MTISKKMSAAPSLNDFAQQFGLYCEGKIDRLQVPEYVGES
ncbi:hypothetical protein [Bifidobacterium longum]|nr:hypothetical protein [Bifidobacterium longum]